MVASRKSELWHYHYVRGEKLTATYQWQALHWQQFLDYLRQSVGSDELSELSLSVLFEPKAKNTKAILSKLVGFKKSSCLLKAVNSYYAEEYHSKIAFKNLPLNCAEDALSISTESGRNSVAEVSFLALLNSADNSVDSSQKTKPTKSKTKLSYLVTPHIERDDLKALGLRNSNDSKQGTVSEMTATGIYLLVDDIRLYVPKDRIRKALEVKAVPTIKQGQQFTVLCNAKGIVQVEITV